jgi:hypothetical protein
MTLQGNSRLVTQIRFCVATVVVDAVVSEQMALWEAEQELGKRSGKHSMLSQRDH